MEFHLLLYVNKLPRVSFQFYIPCLLSVEPSFPLIWRVVFLLWESLGNLGFRGAIKNCTSSNLPAQNIGYSFQLAITAPRLNLIGYGTATAQRYRNCGC